MYQLNEVPDATDFTDNRELNSVRFIQEIILTTPSLF